jgi:hypothetical protein
MSSRLHRADDSIATPFFASSKRSLSCVHRTLLRCRAVELRVDALHSAIHVSYVARVFQPRLGGE